MGAVLFFLTICDLFLQDSFALDFDYKKKLFPDNPFVRASPDHAGVEYNGKVVAVLSLPPPSFLPPPLQQK